MQKITIKIPKLKLRITEELNAITKVKPSKKNYNCKK